MFLLIVDCGFNTTSFKYKYAKKHNIDITNIAPESTQRACFRESLVSGQGVCQFVASFPTVEHVFQKEDCKDLFGIQFRDAFAHCIQSL